jgi:BMFP domain-containing protein YqiC
MKATSLSPLTALILKIVGGLLILSFFLDCVVLLTTAKFQDSQWLLTFTAQLIDQGFVPMVGLGFLFTGIWVASGAIASESAPASSQELRLIALLLASFLGLVFLLLIPLNINSTRLAADSQVQQIVQEAAKAEGQIDVQVQQFRAQLEGQLVALDQAIKQGEVQGEQLAQAQKQRAELQKLKSDPKALEARIAPQRNQELTRIRSRKQEVEGQIQENALRSGMRSGLKSLLLAIGYIIIGWTGLRQMLSK